MLGSNANMSANQRLQCRSPANTSVSAARRPVAVYASNGPSSKISSKPVVACKEDAPNGFAAVSAFCVGVSLLLSPMLPPAQAEVTPAVSQMLVASNSVTSAIPEVPATGAYPAAENLEKYIPNPTVPRANRAVSKEKPEGTVDAPTNLSTLQQHVAFWDFDGDGAIYPIETYKGFRKLGFSRVLSAIAPAVIHGTFSYPTTKSWIPDPALPIYIENMNRTKHGSDSDTYDTEGRFVPQKFEEIFSKYDRDNKGGLSWDDIQDMAEHNQNVHDPIGWTAEHLEWWATYILLKNDDGIVPKEKIRGMYDGSIWNQVAAEVEAKKAAKESGEKVKSDPGMEINTPTRSERGNPIVKKLTA